MAPLKRRPSMALLGMFNREVRQDGMGFSAGFGETSCTVTLVKKS